MLQMFQLQLTKMEPYLYLTHATMSCMSKAYFDKLDSKLVLIQIHTYKVNGADSNSLGPLGTTTCTLEFPKHFCNSS